MFLPTMPGFRVPQGNIAIIGDDCMHAAGANVDGTR